MTVANFHLPYRTDVQLCFDARRALDHRLAAPTTVHVQILSGLARLTGRVGWRGERAEAEAAVRQIPGVRRVLNYIVIETSTQTHPSVPVIRRSAS